MVLRVDQFIEITTARKRKRFHDEAYRSPKATKPSEYEEAMIETSSAMGLNDDENDD